MTDYWVVSEKYTGKCLRVCTVLLTFNSVDGETVKWYFWAVVKWFKKLPYRCNTFLYLSKALDSKGTPFEIDEVSYIYFLKSQIIKFH